MWKQKAAILRERAKYSNWHSEAARVFLENVARDHTAMRWAADDPSIPGIARFFSQAGVWDRSRVLALWERALSSNRPVSEIDWMCSDEGRELGFSLDENLANTVDRRRGITHLNPLAASARKGRTTMVRHLLQHGCKVGDGVSSMNPLVAHLRVASWRTDAPDLPMLKLLVENGAPLTGGYRGPLFTLLKSHGGNRATPWLTTLHTMGMSLWERDGETGDTPLHAVAQNPALDTPGAQGLLDALPVTLEAFDLCNKQGQRAMDIAGRLQAQALMAKQSQLLAQARLTHGDQAGPTVDRSRSRPRC